MKHNIYEIPKVHPFIKTLEKVKALRDNLDEHIEITSQLWEDGKASDAYYYSAEIYHECQKILVNAASLMSCTGNKNAVSDTQKLHTHRQGTNEINPVIQGRTPHTHLDWRG